MGTINLVVEDADTTHQDTQPMIEETANVVNAVMCARVRSRGSNFALGLVITDMHLSVTFPHFTVHYHHVFHFKRVRELVTWLTPSVSNAADQLSATVAQSL